MVFVAGFPGRLAAGSGPGTKIADLQEVVMVLRLRIAPCAAAGSGSDLLKGESDEDHSFED
jgi:hypothetical protein